MEPRSTSSHGWRAYSSAVLIITGVFVFIESLVVLNKATFFASDAVFVFSDLRGWGWIMLGAGIVTTLAGIAVTTGSQWARWAGIAVAGLGIFGQLLFAQAYPLYSLVVTGAYFLTVYGLAVHGGHVAESEVPLGLDSSVTTQATGGESHIKVAA